MLDQANESLGLDEDDPATNRAHLDALAAMDRAALTSLWRARHNTNPPRFARKEFLMRALAFDAQLASDERAQTDWTQLKAMDARAHGKQNAKGLKIGAGARLIREWRGRSIVVDVMEDGYVYDGAYFRSLSAIATKVTGVKRNGPLFFGLRESNGK